MQSDLFSPQHAEVAGLGIQKQGGKMARVSMGGGEVLARGGSRGGATCSWPTRPATST